LKGLSVIGLRSRNEIRYGMLLNNELRF